MRRTQHVPTLNPDGPGKNGIQTNGTLIDERHIRLFQRYKVHVGISVDGPGELNDVRWAGSEERTREATAKTHESIRRLVEAGLDPSLIVTLHRGNATAERLPVLLDWFRELDAMGVRSARLHLMEVESEGVRNQWALSTDENLTALRQFLRLEREVKNLRLDIYKDMRDLLLGRDRGSTCIWNACDPYTTRAVQGVEGNGQKSNCGRTNKDGIDFVKADVEGFERYIALYQTPQEHGGCRGCRFFLMCKGQCPGTSLDGDWRNRTEHCAVWKGILRELEDECLERGETPLSVSPRRQQVEHKLLEAWSQGRNISLADAIEQLDRERQRGGNGTGGRGSSTPRPAADNENKPESDRRPYGLDLLPEVKLPDYARITWVGDAARRVWEPRIAQIMKAWSQIEWLSVKAGVRRCAILTVTPEEMIDKAGELVARGISLLPTALQSAANYSTYSNVSQSPVHGQPFTFRAVAGTPEDLARFKVAWQDGIDEAIGELLGYPVCCREFFRELWVDHGLRDTTWAMALNSVDDDGAGSDVEVHGPAEANILWRWMGVRAVPHLPCSSRCEASVEFGRQMVQVGRDHGFDQEMDWLLEILSWPVQWSGLHGIAEIKTPVLKVSATTDATASKYTVRRPGTLVPAEAARGLRFPYRTDAAGCCGGSNERVEVVSLASFDMESSDETA